MKKIALLLLSLFAASSAIASNVSFSTTATGPRFISTAGTVIANGSLVRVGMMSNPADTSTFVEFGRTTLATVFGQTGRLGGATVNANGEADDDGFNGANVYVWVYNSTTESSTADQGLFRASAATTPWVFPANGGATDSVTLGLAQTDTAITPTTGGPFFIPAAIRPATAVNQWGNFVGLQLAAGIPEPSSLGLVALAGLAALRRKR